MIRQFNWMRRRGWMGLTSVLILAILIATISASLSKQTLANVFGVDEPLAVDVAFVPEIANVDANRIAVEFAIAEGYYLYRDKLQFSIDDINAPTAVSNILSNSAFSQPAVSLDDPTFGEAVIVSDDFFGEQAIFRESTLIDVPYSLGSSQAQTAMLSIKYQGCADIGLCYPPTTVNLPVELPAGNAQSSVSVAAKSSASLANVLDLNSNADDLLRPEQAYLPQILSATANTIEVKWFIEDGYYLYRDKLSFSLQHDDNPQIVKSEVSEGIEQYDEFFGNTQILRHSANATLQLASTSASNEDGLSGTLGELTINYQGCADIGVCFPPSKVTLPVSFIAATGTSASADLMPAATVSGDSNSTGGSAQAATAASNPPAQSEQDRLSSLLGASSLWLTVATFFGLGLLLAFTPCVLPMIPILSSLIVGQGQSMSTARAFQLSLVYVLVMASTYAVVGVVVGLSGYNVQAFLQHPYVLSGIAILFVLLSLSMFGFYELQMPASVQNKMTAWSNKQGGGQIGGVAAMGFISTLIVGPCVTAPLAGALIYIAKTGDALIGGTALFALGLGMGAPLLLIGTSAGKFVPKAGAWMDTTKHIFGILMLGMAIYMISRFLSTTITMGLYGILAVMSGVYLGATDSISRQSSGWHRFGKGAGLVVAFYGIALLAGALAGGGSYTTPLRSLTASSSTGASGGPAQSEHALPFRTIKTVENLQSVVAQASAQGRPVMLDFYADWCVSCKEMEAFTFSDDSVQELLNTAIVVQADVTANDAEDQALLKAFNLFGPPGIIFYDANGTEMPAARVVGFMNAEKFSAHIRRFLFSADT